MKNFSLTLKLTIAAGFVFTAQVFAQNDITLTTYYPSPFGVYQQLQIGDTLQLGTQSTPPACDVGGKVYFDGSNLKVCDGAGNWSESIGAWAQSGSTLVPKSMSYNVGVGTNSPTEKLEVAGNVELLGSQRRIYMGREPADGGPLGLDFKNGQATLSYRTTPRQVTIEDSSSNRKVIFDVDEGANGAAYFAGNVAIGTTSIVPTRSLEVQGKTVIHDDVTLNVKGVRGLKVVGTGTGGGSRGELEMSGDRPGIYFKRRGTTLQDSFIGAHGPPGTNNIGFWTQNGGPGNSGWRMRILEDGTVRMDGDVAIGAFSNPSAKLDVDGDMRVRDNLIVDGLVGIGKSNPTELLDVDGNIFASGNITADGFIYSTSDENLKENIEPISGLDNILQLNGVKYNWKKNGVADIGVIAQNIEEVFPEIVQTNPDTGMKAIRTERIIAPLIEAVKEQQVMIEEQRKMIETQQEQIRALQQKMNQF